MLGREGLAKVWMTFGKVIQEDVCVICWCLGSTVALGLEVVLFRFLHVPSVIEWLRCVVVASVVIRLLMSRGAAHRSMRSWRRMYQLWCRGAWQSRKEHLGLPDYPLGSGRDWYWQFRTKPEYEPFGSCGTLCRLVYSYYKLADEADIMMRVEPLLLRLIASVLAVCLSPLAVLCWLMADDLQFYKDRERQVRDEWRRQMRERKRLMAHAHPPPQEDEFFATVVSPPRTSAESLSSDKRPSRKKRKRTPSVDGYVS